MCARLIPPRLCAAGPPDRVRTRWFLRLRAAPRSARARRAIPPAHAAAVLPDRSPRPPPRAAATAPIRAVPGPPAPAPNPRPNPPPLPERAESPVWPPQTSCGNCQEYPNSRRRFNLTNTPRFDVGTLQLNLAGNSITNSGSFGNFSSTLSNPRVLEFALRYSFYV